MGKNSGIAWCDHTINPLYGCSPASPGCLHCYAARQAARLGKLTEGTHKDGMWTGKINLFPERMEQALRWKKPARIFVGSMSDLFHENVPVQFLDEVFGVILANAYLERQARHQFIILTKRPERMAAYFSQESPTSMIRRWATANDGSIIMDNPDVYFSEAVYGHCSGKWDKMGRLVGVHKDWGYANGLFPLPNTILMTTVENQTRLDVRMPHLTALNTMGWETGVSVEPMLGPIDLDRWIGRNGGMGRCDVCGQPYVEAHPEGCHARCGNTACPRGNDGEWYASASFRPAVSWVIAGCESGPGSRAMSLEWVRALRDQCKAAQVPFFFKQAVEAGKIVHTPTLDGCQWTEFPG